MQMTLVSGDNEADRAHFEALASLSGRPVLMNVIQAFDDRPHVHRSVLKWLQSCYQRGIRVIGQGLTTDAALEAMRSFYADEPFMVVSERSPSTKATLGSNSVHLTARVDPRTGMVMAIATLDNLMKGASGMAVQNANLALGLEETTGLSAIGVYP